LDRFTKILEKKRKKKLEDATGFIKYVVKRGGFVSTPVVNSPQNDTLWSSMRVSEIINVVLGLEMKVYEALLNVQKCASGNNYISSRSIDPDVTILTNYFLVFYSTVAVKNRTEHDEIFVNKRIYEKNYYKIKINLVFFVHYQMYT